MVIGETMGRPACRAPAPDSPGAWGGAPGEALLVEGQLAGRGLAAWRRSLIRAPAERAAREQAASLLTAVHHTADAEAALVVLRRHADDLAFWSTLLLELGPSGSARLLDEISALDGPSDATARASALERKRAQATATALRQLFGSGLALAFAGGELDDKFQGAFLDAAAWDDLFHIVADEPVRGPLAGLLAARLTELGEAQANGFAELLGKIDYAAAMARLAALVLDDPAARQALAGSHRLFGRPVEHQVGAHDGWVATLLAEELPALDPAARRELLRRVASLRMIHEEFQPLLLQLLIEPEVMAGLAALAAVDRLTPNGPRQGTLDEVRPTAFGLEAGRKLIDVLVRTKEAYAELEAAAWAFAQEMLERAAGAGSTGCMERSVGLCAALLSLIGQSRVRLSGDGRRARLSAGERALAEFLFLSRMPLAGVAAPVLAPGALDLGRFMRREVHALPLVTFDPVEFEHWLADQTPRTLLLELARLVLQWRTALDGYTLADRPSAPSTLLTGCLAAIEQHWRPVPRLASTG